MSLFISLISLLSLIFGNDEAEIVFAGDAMMHGSQLEAARRNGTIYDFSEYFADIADYVRDADYAVVNLETPLSKPPFSGYPMFNSPESYADALKEAGFDLFLTANNHTLDRRDDGLRNTLAALDARALDHIGTYKNDSARMISVPLIKEINGIKTGFLNYTYGTNGIEPRGEVKVDYIDKKLIESDIQRARILGAEFIFVCLHWGTEYRLLPEKSQRQLADDIFSMGADAIIGGHPHVIQPIELRDGDNPRLVVYSLGNFISGMRTNDTRGGALVKVKIKRDDDGFVRIDDVSYRLVFTEPADGKNNFRLRWADDSSDPRAKVFKKSARAVYDKHNINVKEDFAIPQILRNFAK